MEETRKRRKKEYQENLVSEYLKLGKQLKQTTQKMLAEKFEINVYSLSAIMRLDNHDFELIKALVEDRKLMLTRRAQLRVMLHP